MWQQQRIYVIFILIWFPIFGWCQNRSKINLLHSQLSKRSGLSRFNLLNDLAFEYRATWPDSTIYFAHQAESLSKELNLTKGKARPLNIIGVSYLYKGNKDSAYTYFKAAFNLASLQNDTLQAAHSLNSIGRVFLDQGMVSQSYEQFIQSNNLFKNIGDSSGLAYTYQSIGNLYNSQNDFFKAEENFKKALEYRLALGDGQGIQSAYIYLAKLYEGAKQYDKSNYCLAKADSISVKFNDLLKHAETQMLISLNLVRLGDLAQGEEIFKEAFHIIIDKNNFVLFPKAYIIFGDIEIARHRYQSALEAYEKALSWAVKRKELGYQVESHLKISTTSKKLGKNQEYLLHYNQYLILKDSVKNIDLVRQMGGLQFEIRVAQEEKEINKLRAEKAEQLSIITKQQEWQIVLILLIVLFSVLGIAFWVISRNRRKVNIQLSQLASDLRGSLKKIEENERNLKNSAQLLNGVINNTSSSIFIKDIVGKYVLVNAAFAKKFGKAPEEIKGKTAYDIFSKEDAEKVTNDEAELLRSKESLTFEVNVKNAYGEAFLVTNKFVLFDEQHQAYAVCGVSTDVTETRRTEANLKAIFDSALVSIIQTNTTGLITHFNRGAEILLGYQAEELVNIHSPQLIHLKDEVMQRGNELSTLYGKEIMGFDVFVEEAKMGRFDSREWSYVRKDGTIFPVQLVVTSIRDRKNFIIGYLGIATDISELKTQHQLIELQRDDLEKLNATKDKFFSIVAHDLKSPLNSLKSFSDLLLTYYDRLTKEDILKMSRELSSSITNTIKMADNLITWAQLQMDDYQFNEDIVSVEEVIASICSVYTDVAMKKDIRLSQSIENSLEILGDKNQIEFIFRNLVNNAIKYTNPNGLVSITAKTLSSGEIEIGVEDNGIGIDENTKSKLFSSYKVRSEKGTAGESGTGLGLMLCQEFVTLNKGEISVDSEPGNGTTFYVRFRKPETERIHT